MRLFLADCALYNLDFTQTHTNTQKVFVTAMWGSPLWIWRKTPSLLSRIYLPEHPQQPRSSQLPILSFSSCHLTLVMAILMQCWWWLLPKTFKKLDLALKHSFSHDEWIHWLMPGRGYYLGVGHAGLMTLMTNELYDHFLTCWTKPPLYVSIYELVIKVSYYVDMEVMPHVYLYYTMVLYA